MKDARDIIHRIASTRATVPDRILKVAEFPSSSLFRHHRLFLLLFQIPKRVPKY
jgi:hypothetical protein